MELSGNDCSGCFYSLFVILILLVILFLVSRANMVLGDGGCGEGPEIQRAAVWRDTCQCVHAAGWIVKAPQCASRP